MTRIIKKINNFQAEFGKSAKQLQAEPKKLVVYKKN